jgi:hypothetical protein
MKKQEQKTRPLIQKYLDALKAPTIAKNELTALFSILNGGRGNATEDEKELLKKPYGKSPFLSQRNRKNRGLSGL